MQRHFTTVAKLLNETTIGQHVSTIDYAVRGDIFHKSQELQAKLAKGEKLPFKKLYKCNLGNPQVLGLHPPTFNRQVLSIALNPKCLDHEDISEDAKERGKFFLDQVEFGALGAYTESHGFKFVRDSVAKFLKERDSFGSNTDQIFLTNGGCQGIHIITTYLISGPQDAMLIPVPKFPVYSAALKVAHGSEIPYELEEESGWSLNVDKLERSVKKAKAENINVKAIAVINPGNPTGQVLSYECIRDIINFAYENKLLIIADEVYQENIYTQRKFYSFKRVMNELGAPYNQMELVSLNSASKGFLGECGLRGGYMELANFQPYALNCMYKLRSIDCCSNTIGQLLVELMTNPPKRGVNSDAVVDLHEKELNAVFKSMKLNADALTQKINNMEGLSTVPVQGAMYAFPKIEMPLKAKEEAARRKIHPDLLYCFEALNNTGITLVPGAGFGQKEGTNHFRITNLVFDTQEFSEMLDQFAEFNSQFQKKYK